MHEMTGLRKADEEARKMARSEIKDLQAKLVRVEAEASALKKKNSKSGGGARSDTSLEARVKVESRCM